MKGRNRGMAHRGNSLHTEISVSKLLNTARIDSDKLKRQNLNDKKSKEKAKFLHIMVFPINDLLQNH